MAYRLVWLCTDIIRELEKKYPRSFMGTIDNKDVFELFQCPTCEEARIVESEGLEDLNDKTAFQEKVEVLKKRLSETDF